MDQYYYETGYLDENYFVYVADAEITMSASFRVSNSDEATYGIGVLGEIADTTGYYLEGYIDSDYFSNGGTVQEATVELNVIATTVASPGKLIEANVGFDVLFTPSFVVEGIKFVDCLMATVSTMSTDLSANRNANIALDTLITYSLMGDWLRFANAELMSETTINSNASKLSDNLLELNSNFNFNILFTTRLEPTTISVTSSLVASPISWSAPAQSRTTSIIVNDAPIYDDIGVTSTTKKFGDAAAYLNYTYDSTKLTPPIWNGTNWYVFSEDDNLVYYTSNFSDWTSETINGLGGGSASAKYIRWDSVNYRFVLQLADTLYTSTDGANWISNTLSYSYGIPDSGRPTIVEYGKVFTYDDDDVVGSYRVYRANETTASWDSIRDSGSGTSSQHVQAYNGNGRVAFFQYYFTNYPQFTNRVFYVTSGTSTASVRTLSTINYNEYVTSGFWDGINWYYVTSDSTYTTYRLYRNGTKLIESSESMIADYKGGVYFLWKNSNNTLYKSDSGFGNLVATNTPLDTDFAIIDPRDIQYADGKFAYVVNTYGSVNFGKVYTSTDGTNWVDNGLITGLLDIDFGGIRVNNSDIQNWKTIDFWIKAPQTVSGGAISPFAFENFDFSYTMLLQLSPPKVYIRNYIDTDGNGLPTYTEANTSTNWTHFRLQRNGTQIKVYVDGQFSAELLGPSSYANQTLKVYGLLMTTATTVYIDEFLVTKEYLNPYTDTSFVTPSQPWSNTANTALLLHFDEEPFADDANANNLIEPQAYLSSSTSMSATPNITVDGITVYLGQFIETVNPGIIHSGNVIDTPYSSAFEISIDADRYRQVDLTANVVSNFEVIPSHTVSFESDLNAIATFEVEGGFRRFIELNCDSFATLTTEANYSVDNQSDLYVNSTLEATTSGLINVSVNTNTQAILTIEPGLIQDNSASLNASTSLSAEGIISVSANAELNVVTVIETNNERYRDAQASFESFATDLTVAAKIGEFVIDYFISSNLGVDTVIIADSTSTLNAIANVESDVDRIRDYDASAELVFDTVINGRLSTDVASVQSFTANITTDAVKIADTTVTMSGALDFNTSVRAIRNEEVDIVVSSTMSIDANRVRDITFENTATASIETNVTIIKETSSILNTVVSLTADGRIAHILEYVYVIPNENRAFTINEETRTFQVQSENRQYTLEGA